MKLVNVSDVCNEVFAGGDVPKDNWVKVPTSTHNIPIYSNGEANDGLYGYTDYYRVKEPSVTVSARGTIGHTVVRMEPFVPVVRLITLVPKTEVIDLKYLCYAIQNYKFDGTGTSIPQLTVPMLKQYTFKLVELSEQKRIVQVIDKIAALIENRKQQLQKLDELIKARFVEMFGDIVVNTHSLPAYLLKDLALLITKGASPNWQGFNYIEDEEQTLFITSENVREGYLDFSKSKYIEDGFNEKQKRSVLQKGDFLINIVGASIGRAAQFKIDKKANINQAVALVRVEDERIVDGYLLEYLNSEKALQMYFAMQSDTGRANLSLEDIGNLVILLPPVNEQRIFDVFVQEINKSKLSVQKSLDKLELLKKALMQKYFG